MRILLCGCNGKMGRVVTNLVAARCDCEIVAGVDINLESHAGFPVFGNPDNCAVEADVIIDFSHPSGLPAIVRYARAKQLPLVVATTGLSEQDEQLLADAAADTAIFKSANMSLGISVLAELCKVAAGILGDGFDVEIVEKHHNQKVDAPSGTALLLGKAVSSALPYEPQPVFDRHAVRKKRAPHEIGYSSVRGGTIPGEHDVLFCGHDEVITLSHTAQSKESFASGALSAAEFLLTKPAGFYTMADLVHVGI